MDYEEPSSTSESRSTVHEMLDSEEYQRHKNQVDGLRSRAEVGDDVARDELLAIAQNRNEHPEVRVMALGAMQLYSDLGKKADVEKLCIKLLRDPRESEPVRAYAAETLSWDKGQESLSCLIEVAESGEVPKRVRIAASEALASFDDPAARKIAFS